MSNSNWNHEAKNEDLVMTERNEEEEEEEEEESKIYPDSPAISIPKFASDFSDHYEGSSQHQWNDMDEKGDAVFYTMHMEKSIIDQDFMAEIATFDDDFDDDDLS
ncbi:hypothetical protein RMATCC62417_02640 [Rhizopus microsporus]|nr:hypothetical protein RMATCC62417_02640 [Rhizopus microsporus]